MFKKPAMNTGIDSQTRPVAKLPSELVVKEAFSPPCQTLPATMSPTELVVKRLSAPCQNEAKISNKKWEDNVKIRNKYYDICNNCGKQGHTFKQCKNPITSFGVIIFRINQNQRQYLMIRRKDTLGYIDFMRGKYSVTNHKYILNMLKQMTVSEKHKLSSFTFDDLWNELWSGARITDDICDQSEETLRPLPVNEISSPMESVNNSYRQEETNSRDKFLYLSTKLIGNCNHGSINSEATLMEHKERKPEKLGKGQNATELLTSKGALHPEKLGMGQTLPGCVPIKLPSELVVKRLEVPCQTILQYLLMISNIPETLKSDADPIPQEGGGWLEPEWGFPKGRRNYQEKDYECALREMMEETGYSPNNVKNIKNIIPFDEIFLGSNYKSYKHRYYLMYMNYHDSLSMDNFEKSEVSCMEWKSYDECMKSIRSYNLEKKRLITNIEQTLSKYRLFFHPNTV
uniref:Nudix hydrolase domain-containing protein n=1 Tax=viral metagenome TaxID=1070528 RepID=A0A6C0IDN1_9ZZZZ